MKTKTLAILASVFALALAIAPSLSFSQQVPPVTVGGPQIGDMEQLIRPQANGSVINPTFTLGGEINLAFSLISFPQGGQSATLNTATSQLTIVPALFTSPTPALGYSTGLGCGQTITQLTSKTTAVVMPAACFTGTITMNNASLASGAGVKFQVTDSAVAASDVVNVSVQYGTQTAAGSYLVSTAAANGYFYVLVYNFGTTESDAIVLNFVVNRASGN
jgi:hypothetical protein